MNMYKKEEVTYTNGYIVKDDKVVAIDNEIVDLFNKLEEDVQRAKWEKENCLNPSVSQVKPFIRKTERGAVYPMVLPETPELDKQAEQAIKLMDEFDEIHAAHEINEYLDGISSLFVFAKDEFIVDCDHSAPHRFDLPTLGDPLKLTSDDIVAFVVEMFTHEPVAVDYEQE